VFSFLCKSEPFFCICGKILSNLFYHILMKKNLLGERGGVCDFYLFKNFVI
jgi:hypothetical protein